MLHRTLPPQMFISVDSQEGGKGKGKGKEKTMTDICKSAKCDLQTPKCGQCRKACLPCQAYVKQYFFAHDVSTKIRPWMAALNGAPNADKPLTTAAYATNMVDLFWSAYLPNGRQPTDWGIRIPRALFDAASTLYTTGGSGGAPSNASSAAVSAIALTTTGVKNGDDSLVKEGTRRYTEALQATATALALPSPQAKQRFSVLVAVRILSLYEVLYHFFPGQAIFSFSFLVEPELLISE